MPNTAGWDTLDHDVLATFRAAASQPILGVARALPYQPPVEAVRASLEVLVGLGYLTHQHGYAAERWNLTATGRTHLTQTQARTAAA